MSLFFEMKVPAPDSTDSPTLQTRRAFMMLAAGASVALGLPATAHAGAGLKIHALDVRRDAGCGCCGAWVDAMRATGRFRVRLRDAPDMAAVKKRLGVPEDLASCHTATVEGLVLEGHVPPSDVLKFLSRPDRSILGLAVAGMPVGAPGMEQGDSRRDKFDVVAFRKDGVRSVFAAYPAKA